MTNEKVYHMKLSKVYQALVNKAIRKDRNEEEVKEIIYWLCGYDENSLQEKLDQDVDYGDFFLEAPCFNPKASLIKGKICGIKVEEIEDPLMQKIRYLDKLVDELAKGKQMEKIKREK